MPRAPYDGKPFLQAGHINSLGVCLIFPFKGRGAAGFHLPDKKENSGRAIRSFAEKKRGK
jgi:hypothetical protein